MFPHNRAVLPDSRSAFIDVPSAALFFINLRLFQSRVECG
jgi:hypothetical protein